MPMSEYPDDATGRGASVSPEQADADGLDLRASLADLAGLVTGTIGMDDVLSRVATYAHRAIPGADGVGVTLLRAKGAGNHVEALAASAPFVAEIDEIQYGVLNEGPCISAARGRRTVRSGSLESESKWPRFGPQVSRLGVHSVLSLPLLLPDRVVGAMNVYAHAKDVFDDHAVELGEMFAVPAAVAVHNAQVLAQAMALTTQLQTALSSRPIIDQAVGIVRSRSGCNAEEAFARLHTISQNENTRLITVAQRVVDEAVRRTRAKNARA